MFHTFFDKKFSGRGIKSEVMLSQELAQKLHKSVISKFNKRKKCSFLKDDIWGADLLDIQLMSEIKDNGIE